jgi:hypothetical protein
MSHAHESGGEGARMAPRQRIERATGLLLVTAILVIPWAARRAAAAHPAAGRAAAQHHRRHRLADQPLAIGRPAGACRHLSWFWSLPPE